MDKDKVEGVKEQLKGIADFTIGKFTGNKDLELKGQVEITNGSNKKDLADFKDNVKKGVDDPDNPSNE
ncbi:CsbD-like protein [Caballeronia sordidicola]|uniref:CsbD-like protein n=1 Tax=Caballeronia sordidicola TaxID=196367 RepID=A0A158I0E8_CABSO|nr:CsbD family protein [Caballeronia sordidicola]SAL50026.1 CsbD-like protein [Caballeronia sordidicola]